MLEKPENDIKHNSRVLFDSLTPFDIDQNYLKLIRDISGGVIENNPIESQIHHIEDLRRMRKYQSDLFGATFSNILPSFVANLLESSKPDVCLNALTLVSEIFSLYGVNEIGDWIPDLLPVIIGLSVSHLGLISRQSLHALNNLAHHMHYTETLDTLLEIILEKDKAQSEMACETLIVLICDVDKFNLLNNFHWYDACNYIFTMLQSGKIELIETAKIVLYHLKIKFNSEYDNYLSFYENDDRRKIVEERMKDYRCAEKFTKFETFLKGDY